MPKHIFRTGKKQRPKIADKGKRYLCAREMPQTKPETGKNSRTLDLSEMQKR